MERVGGRRGWVSVCLALLRAAREGRTEVTKRIVSDGRSRMYETFGVGEWLNMLPEVTDSSADESSVS